MTLKTGVRGAVSAIIIPADKTYPWEDYSGNRVIPTDELIEGGDFGWRFFESRAITFAERHVSQIPSYHLRVQRIGFLRYSIKAYQNRLELKE
jgi:hypothetical protein